MPKIKIDSIQEGMVVANDVKNIDNMLLIPAGCTLTERQINILQAWGVAEIEVVATQADDEKDPFSKLSAEELERVMLEIKERFWQVDEANPVFLEIFKIILQRRVNNTAKELTSV